MKIHPKLFRAWCRANGLPRPDAEVTIIPGRRFRYDFAWPAFRIVLEVQGGVYMRGKSGHSSGTGIARDQEKLNRATVEGWRMLQIQPRYLMTTQTRDWLRVLLREAV